MWADARPLLTTVAVWVVLSLVVGAGASWWQGPAEAQTGETSEESSPDTAGPARGETLWNRECASCHGRTGDGSDWAPSLHDKGPAGVQLTVETGRMPIDQLAPFGSAVTAPDELVEIGEPSYPPEQIADLVAYSRTILRGPDVGSVDVASADVSHGQELFQLNCAACHSWSGRGGALTSGEFATNLLESSPTQVVQAMRTGLGTMPVFSEDTFDHREAASIARYVAELPDPRQVGSFGLAYWGPVAEGAVAWLVGLLGIVLVVRWIGAGS